MKLHGHCLHLANLKSFEQRDVMRLTSNYRWCHGRGLGCNTDRIIYKHTHNCEIKEV